MLNRGICEIAGLKGSTKTTFVLNLTIEKRILYFSSKKFPYNLLHKIYKIKECTNNCESCAKLEKIYIKNVNTLEILKTLIFNIEEFIINKKIELIVIDTLDTLCIEDNNVYRLVQKLKNISFKYTVKIYILNELIDKKNGTSYRMGMHWRYSINERILLKKNKTIKLNYQNFVEEQSYEKEYKIENGIIKYLN